MYYLFKTKITAENMTDARLCPSNNRHRYAHKIFKKKRKKRKRKIWQISQGPTSKSEIINNRYKMTVEMQKWMQRFALV